MLRIATAFLLSLAAIFPAAPSVFGQQQKPVVYEVPVDGTIELGIAPFIKRALAEAEKAKAKAVVLDINTLGGRVDAALQIVDAITNSPVPVYAFVNPRAISAGALIAVATDSVFMVPDALLGASTVVGSEGEKVSEKAQSVMRAQYRALAERRGLDPRIGEAMVDEDIVIPNVIEKGKLLTLTSHEAATVGYAVEVKDLNGLLSVIGVTNAEIVRPELNWAERLVRFFTNPLVASILLPLGILGLLTEVKASTFGVAGGVGVAAIALFFGSHMLVGLAGWEELLLLGIGVVLLLLEIFIIPGFGIAGIAGIAGIGAAFFLALIGDYSSPQDISRAVGVIIAALAIVIVALFFIVRYLPKRKKSGIFLMAATTSDSGYISADSRVDLFHAEGVTLTDLRPTGTALFGTERVDVVSDAGFLPRGSRVRVVQAEPYRTVVLPVDELSSDSVV